MVTKDCYPNTSLQTSAIFRWPYLVGVFKILASGPRSGCSENPHPTSRYSDETDTLRFQRFGLGRAACSRLASDTSRSRRGELLRPEALSLEGPSLCYLLLPTLVLLIAQKPLPYA